MSDVIFPRPTEAPWGFTQEDWDEIRRLAHAPDPPPKWKNLGAGCSVPSRAWSEWLRARGRDPKNPKARGTVSAKKREAVLRRDGFVCQICGGRILLDELHIDHIHPVARGGSDDVENLQAAHAMCNLRKGTQVA